jgi:hypothetical protein
MAVANITLLLIHWSMTTYGDEYEAITEIEDREGNGTQGHDPDGPSIDQADSVENA